MGESQGGPVAETWAPVERWGSLGLPWVRLVYWQGEPLAKYWAALATDRFRWQCEDPLRAALHWEKHHVHRPYKVNEPVAERKVKH